jgi:putative acetyltransferase
MSFEIRAESSNSDAARALTEAQRDELRSRYGHDGSGGDPETSEFARGGAFLVARLDGRPVGCGGVRRLEAGVAEIKRMFVVREARGTGVGPAVLEALEDVARRAGYARVKLETGMLQTEAVALYESAGYRRIPRYGPFVDDPLSVCFERALAS